MPSITRLWTSFHLAAATGAEASLQRMTNARLKGTPAASKLDSRRVKFSSIRAETFLDPPSDNLNAGGNPFAFCGVTSGGGVLGGGTRPIFGAAFAGLRD